MWPQSRDPGITRITARDGQRCYGMGLGILILDDIYPGFPGDVRNASAYPYPIQYEIVTGVDIPALVEAEDKSPCLKPVLAAVDRLRDYGCRAILGECGYFAYFQQEVSEHVNLPVYMSSLLQAPMAQQVIGRNQAVGIIVARADYLTKRHLTSVGINPDSNIIIQGVMDAGNCPELDKLWTAGKRSDPPGALFRKAEDEFLQVVVEFCCSTPELGALVLECTGFPPFARALQRAVDLPIYSWGTMLDYAYSVSVHRDYYGHV